MKRLAKYVSLALLFAVILSAGSVSFVSAQTGNLNGINNLVKDATNVLNTVIILLTAVCVVVFIVGLIKYVFNKGADARTEGRTYMIWSVVAFAVLSALFALANFLANLLFDEPTLQNGGGFGAPQIKLN